MSGIDREPAAPGSMLTGTDLEPAAPDPPLAGDRLERLLALAADDATWPATPDLAASVAARIVAPATPNLRPAVLARVAESRSPHPRRRPASFARILRPVLLAATVGLVVAGVATGLGFRLPGATIERVDQLPPAGTGLDLGRPIPLADALAFDAPHLRLPDALPPPTGAFVLEADGVRIVTVAWRAAAGQPVLPGSGDLSLSLMAVPGDVDEPLLQKLLGPGTTIEPVTVYGERGWWIAGAPHEILIRRGSDVVVLRAAIAGDTLLFAREGTLYRLESTLGRDATIAIAATLR